MEHTIILAKAVLASATEWIEARGRSDYDRYVCRHCEEDVKDQSSYARREPQEKLIHKDDCPMLLARSFAEHPDDCI
jgi:hypothetical protein